VDLTHVQHNYQVLRQFLKDSGSPETVCSAVVKANAYGAGALPVAGALYEEKCRDFFVADYDEALRLRPSVPEGRIFVFSGIVPGSSELFAEQGLIPTLLHKEQILDWQKEAQRRGHKLPAVLHIDTGMSRTGLMGADIDWLLDHREILEAFDLQFIMSHLACSCDRSAAFNEVQLERFRVFLKHFPGAKASFVASEGVAFGKSYHFDMVRPGKFLLGLGELVLSKLKPVIHVYSRVLEVVEVVPGQSIGYEGAYTFEHRGRVASLGIGYADGISRALGNRGTVKINGKYAPMVGRVSMDCVSVDITEIEGVAPGDWATLVNEDLSPERLAKYTGTISREFCCLLGQRPYRLYRKKEGYDIYTPFGKCCAP
jgi:alanine racemase